MVKIRFENRDRAETFTRVLKNRHSKYILKQTDRASLYTQSYSRLTLCPSAPSESMPASVPAFRFHNVCIFASFKHVSSSTITRHDLFVLGGFFVQLTERAYTKLALCGDSTVK